MLDGDSGEILATTVGATFELGADEPDQFGVTGNTVWYAWTPSVSGEATITMEAAFDPTLAVYTGTALGNLEVVGVDAQPNGAAVDFTASVGTTYYVQVGTYDDSPGLFGLGWTIAASLSNDNWADAFLLEGASGSTTGSNVGATTESGEPLDFTIDGTPVTTGKTVWWKWVAPASGGYVFDTIDSQFDNVLGIFTGTDVAALSEVDVEYNPGGDFTDAAVFHADAGTTYYVQVGGNGGDWDGDIVLHWRPNGLSNDDFAGAIVLDDDNGSLQASNVEATIESGEPDPSEAIGKTVWYEWTPGSSGFATFSVDTDPTDAYAALAVYTGGALDSLVPVNDDHGSSISPSPSVSFAAEAGTTYFIQIGSYSDADIITFDLGWSFVPSSQHYVVTTWADFVDDANCQVGSCTLRQAVNAANLGGGADEIEVPAGAYHLEPSFGELVVSAGMTITGAGALPTQIYGPTVADRSVEGDRVFEIESGVGPVVIESILLRGGSANTNNGCFGGNLLNAGDLTLREVWITDGAACSGGGVSNAGGTLLVERSTFSGNQALFGGGDSGAIQNWGDGASLHGSVTIRNSHHQLELGAARRRRLQLERHRQHGQDRVQHDLVQRRERPRHGRDRRRGDVHGRLHDRLGQQLRRLAEQLRRNLRLARKQPRERHRLRLHRGRRPAEHRPAARGDLRQRRPDLHAGAAGRQPCRRRRHDRVPDAGHRSARHRAPAGRGVRHRRLRARADHAAERRLRERRLAVRPDRLDRRDHTSRDDPGPRRADGRRRQRLQQDRQQLGLVRLDAGRGRHGRGLRRHPRRHAAYAADPGLRGPVARRTRGVGNARRRRHGAVPRRRHRDHLLHPGDVGRGLRRRPELRLQPRRRPAPSGERRLGERRAALGRDR